MIDKQYYCPRCKTVLSKKFTIRKCLACPTVNDRSWLIIYGSDLEHEYKYSGFELTISKYVIDYTPERANNIDIESIEPDDRIGYKSKILTSLNLEFAESLPFKSDSELLLLIEEILITKNAIFIVVGKL
jgi:hypothetical protein